jgi:phospholipid/cholesterol/gamma-HCH transport system substrate-binding protein
MPRTRSIAWAELKIGIIGVTAIALASALVIAVSGQGGFSWQRFPVKTIFDDVQGMRTGAVVRVSGRDVGKVTSVAFSGAKVEVGLELSKEVRPLITDQSVASMGSLSLLGEPIILISAAPQGTPVEDWAYITSDQSSGAFADAATAAATALEQGQNALVLGQQLMRDVQSGRESLGKLVTDDALYREMTTLAASASALTTQIASGKGTVGALMNDPQVRIDANVA